MADQPSLIVPPSGSLTAHCFRLRPNDALMPSLKQASTVILSKNSTQCGSAFVITAVGSLQDVTIRLANASMFDGEDKGNEIKRLKQRFEIVSLTGTFSREDGCHIHISLADAEGNVIGGHLIDGVVFTTCEVVLGTAEGVEFMRELDKETGYRELVPLQLATSNFNWGHIIFGRYSAVMLFAGAGFVLGKMMKSK